MCACVRFSFFLVVVVVVATAAVVVVVFLCARSSVCKRVSFVGSIAHKRTLLVLERCYCHSAALANEADSRALAELDFGHTRPSVCLCVIRLRLYQCVRLSARLSEIRYAFSLVARPLLHCERGGNNSILRRSSPRFHPFFSQRTTATPSALLRHKRSAVAYM